MHLDSINVDARDPARALAFWSTALELPIIRRQGDGAAVQLPSCGLELWFLQVDDVQDVRERRLHFDLGGQSDPAPVVARLLTLGARPLDIGQGQTEWTVLQDPAGDAFCVLPDRGREFREAGLLSCLVVDSADPERDRDFWHLATGWLPLSLHDAPALCHPSGCGIRLAFYPELSPKSGTKNWLHLDLRLGPDDDAAAELDRLFRAGATRVPHDWGALDWEVLADPSGNEFCVLPSSL